MGLQDLRVCVLRDEVEIANLLRHGPRNWHSFTCEIFHGVKHPQTNPPPQLQVQGEGYRPTSQRQKYQGGFWHYKSVLQVPILQTPFHRLSYPRKIILLITLAQNTRSNLHCSHSRSQPLSEKSCRLYLQSIFILCLLITTPQLWSWHKMSTSVFSTIEEISYSLTVALGVCV